MKLKFFIGVLSALMCVTPVSAYDTDDYAETMTMAVKFFGGQRCGDTHNWLLKDNDDIKGDRVCHVKDEYKGHDVTGGWHDCGDHIKVAHTMGYAAVCLMTSYDLWPGAFEDAHDQNYGAKNGIKDVLDEVKVATDFFMKCLIDDKEFVYYVGKGGPDHQVWATSAHQSTLPNEKGGEADGPRTATSTTTGGGWQAMNYATALALMSKYYPDENYAKKCLEYAKKYYEFAQTHRSTSGVQCDEFYGPGNTAIQDEYALAGAVMYKVTGDSKYKEDALKEVQGVWESNSPLAWDTVADIMYYYIVEMEADADNGGGGTIFSLLDKNVKKFYDGGNEYGVPWGIFTSKWGTNKLACGAAFAFALYAKLIEDGVVKEGQISKEDALKRNGQIVNYMMGDNEFGHPFIHGLFGDMTARVHHRNAMGRDDNPPSDVKNTCDFKFGNGGLLGGPTTEGSFANLIEDANYFMETEGGCDYNGPLVGALANIVASKISYPESNVFDAEAVVDDLSINAYPNPFNPVVNLAISLNEASVKSAKVYNLKGEIVKSFATNSIVKGNNNLTWNASNVSSGVYFFKLTTASGAVLSKKLILLK